MKNIGFRYTGLLGVVTGMFVTFVACGSQMYKASLQGDTPALTMATNADEAGNPSSPTYGIHATEGWTATLPLHYKTDYTMSADQIKGIKKAISTWETAVGRPLFAYDGVHQSTSGDTFPDLYSSLGDMINGLYLDGNWGKTGKAADVLATTIWDNNSNDINQIVTGDLRFDNQNYVFGDALVIKGTDSREVVDIQTLATHELGHLLGLAHISPTVDAGSIMVPSLYIGEGLSDRRVSRGDIERIQKIYGCQGSSCDIDATLAKINVDVSEPSGENLTSR